MGEKFGSLTFERRSTSNQLRSVELSVEERVGCSRLARFTM